MVFRKIFFSLLFLITSGFSLMPCLAQDFWTQKTSILGSARDLAVGFSIGTKGYIGTGLINNVTETSDFWQWNQASNTWTQKANFAGGARDGAVGFSIGSKGYIGTGGGYDPLGNPVNFNDFWEWDQATNIWTQKANFGGSARVNASGFSVGNKGYIGGGVIGTPSTNDFWEWDQATNIWTKKANIPGTRWAAIGFSIGKKGYMGLGDKSPIGIPVYLNDFCEYDPATDIWTQKANFGGIARVRAVGFSIGSYGFAGTGVDNPGNFYNDWWRYDPCNDTWTRIADFGGAARGGAVGFSIGCKGYTGTGDINSGNYIKDFWEYDPALWSIPATATASSNTLCAGQSATLSASCGGIRYLWNTGATDNPLLVSPIATTTYSVYVIRDSCDSVAAAVTVTVDPIINSFSNVTDVDCFGNSNGSAEANGSGGIPVYTYLWNSNPPQTTQAASGLHAGIYVVSVTDSLGCSVTDSISITSPTGLGVASPVVENVKCFGASTGTATVTATGGTPGYSYSWNPTGQTTSTATGLAAGTDTITITDNNGCIIKTIVSVTQPSAVVTTISSDTSICPGTSVTDIVTATGGTPGYTYLWMNVGATTTSIFISPAGTTTYTAQITDANGCSTQLMTTVTVVPNPAAFVSYTSDHCGGPVQFIDSSANATSWSWNFGDGTSASSVQNPSHGYASAGSYSVMLTSSGQLNCKTTDQLMVDVLPFSQLFIPNAFSPNNDNNNEMYYVSGKCVTQMTFIIYDRWGEKVFEYSGTEMNAAQGWDGKYKGQLENAGVFMYDFNGTLSTGEKINQKGNITLMR